LAEERFMGSRNALPLIDQIVLRPFLELLDGRGVPSEKLLTQAHLPRHADTAVGQFVSARSLLQFLSISAREEESSVHRDSVREKK
jgi:hypothetical protein